MYKNVFKRYSELELKSMSNGSYLLKYDPNMDTDFWQPNDEIITLKDGEIISHIGIKSNISQIKTQLTKIETNYQKDTRWGRGKKLIKRIWQPSAKLVTGIA